MRFWRLALRVASWATLGTALAMPKLRERIGIPPAAALAAVTAGIPAAAVALPPRRWRPYGIFMAQMWTYLRGFELTYADKEALRRRLRIEEPIKADRLLFRGRAPTERLQRVRASWRRPDLADRAFGAVYFAWALERHAVLAWILWRHPERFARAAALVAATFDACWVLFTAFPAAPPWWAGKTGYLRARRLTVDASKRLPLVPTQNEDDDDQGNPWASTPSQHAASAVMIAMVASEIDGRVGAAACVYAGLLGLALVYLGEHYLIDVVSGIGLAAAVHRLEPPARGPARKLSAVFDRVRLTAWDRAG